MAKARKPAAAGGAPKTVMPLSEKDFFSSDEEADTVFNYAKKPAAVHAPVAAPETSSGPGYLSITELAEDATSREVHVLFSGCPGFVDADVAVEAISRRAHAIVQFDRSDSAVRAVQSRRGTTWAPGQGEVLMDILSTDVGSRRLAAVKQANGDFMRRPTSMRQDHSNRSTLRCSVAFEADPQRSQGGGRSMSPQRSASPVRNRGSMAPPPLSGEDGGGALTSPSTSPYRQRASTTPPRQRDTVPPSRGRTLEPGGPGAVGTLSRSPSPRGVRRERSESPSGGAPAASGRSAHVRQLLMKVEAAAAARKVEDLEALLAEAAAAGAAEADLREARQVLGDRQTTVARRKAIHAETRSKAKLIELFSSGIFEEQFKTTQLIETLASSIRGVFEAASLCASAGLGSKEGKLRAQANQVLQVWREHCVSKVCSFLEAKDASSLGLVLAECEFAGLEQNLDTRAIIESARRIVSGKSAFGDEAKLQDARVVYTRARMAKSAPALREAVKRMEQVGVEEWEIARARAAYEEAEQKVAARWGLIYARMSYSMEGIMHQPVAIAMMKDAVAHCKKLSLPAKLYEDHVQLVKRFGEMENKAQQMQEAFGKGRLSQIEWVARQTIGGQDESTQALISQAQDTLNKERSKAVMQRRMEATMHGRKTVILRTMPGAISEAQGMGMRESFIEKAEETLATAQAAKRLEEAMQSQEVWVLRSAMDEAKRCGVNSSLINVAQETLKEVEGRAAINSAIQQGDRIALEKAIENWNYSGYDLATLQSAKAMLRSMETRAKELGKKLDKVLAEAPIDFEDYKPDVAPHAVPIVREVAKILKKYGDIAIHINGHGSGRLERAAVKLSQDRADSVGKMLTALGVTNMITTKGWGSSHQEFKKKMIRIYPV